MENYFWFYSTVAQVFAAIWAVTGMFAVFRLELLDRKIKDALRSLLNFMLVSVDVRSSFAWEYITQLENIKQHVIEEIEESDKKEYFGWDTEILLNKPKETKYIISEYDSYVKKESVRIDKQKKEKKENNKQLSDQDKNNLLTEEKFNEFRTRKIIHQIERDCKNALIKYLTVVTILDGLIVVASLFVLFYLSKPIPLKINLGVVLLPVFVISTIAIMLSAGFILLYCRRR